MAKHPKQCLVPSRFLRKAIEAQRILKRLLSHFGPGDGYSITWGYQAGVRLADIDPSLDARIAKWKKDTGYDKT